MDNLNSVLLEGNLVRDPLIRSTPKGTSVCSFAIASNRFFRQDSGLEKETGFFNVEAWGKLAEACGANGRKGTGVRVVGRLRQYRWKNSAGESASRTVIVAEHAEFRPRSQSKADAEASPELEFQELPTELELESCTE